LSYRDGQGLPQNYSEAFKWFTVAVTAMSGADLKKAMEVRDALARELSPAQAAEAEKSAREWLDALDRRKPRQQ
jgi:TPR repeat protein